MPNFLLKQQITEDVQYTWELGERLKRVSPPDVTLDVDQDLTDMLERWHNLQVHNTKHSNMVKWHTAKHVFTQEILHLMGVQEGHN